jgi:bifunctional DNA-binding transcriptional regulator/antitoxin component of YhaV-PrlF toxin-antitoxin module
MTKSMTKLGEGGRLVIPVEYRKALGVTTGDDLVLVLEPGALRVLTPREGLRQAQALVREHIPRGRRLADELIEERRKESEHD